MIVLRVHRWKTEWNWSISPIHVFTDEKICCIHVHLMRHSITRQMCLDRSVLPSEKEDDYSMFYTFNVLWCYQSRFRCTKLKKPIVWNRIGEYFANGSASPLALPSTLNHGDSSLILFFLIAILSATLPAHCPVVVVLFPVFCAFVALLEAPRSYGKHWCVEPCGASWDICTYSQ